MTYGLLYKWVGYSNQWQIHVDSLISQEGTHNVIPTSYLIVTCWYNIALYSQSNLFLDDWKADQYWRYQNERKQLISIPVIQKVHAININSAGKNPQFKRSSYSLLDDTKNECLTLIHYTGDYTTANKLPHGNSTSKEKKAYVRTCPSVLQAAGEVQDVPSNVYKIMVAEADCANIISQY